MRGARRATLPARIKYPAFTRAHAEEAAHTRRKRHAWVVCRSQKREHRILCIVVSNESIGHAHPDKIYTRTRPGRIMLARVALSPLSLSSVARVASRYHSRLHDRAAEVSQLAAEQNCGGSLCQDKDTLTTSPS